jgi:hypothetical protein
MSLFQLLLNQVHLHQPHYVLFCGLDIQVLPAVVVVVVPPIDNGRIIIYGATSKVAISGDNEGKRTSHLGPFSSTFKCI